MTTVQQVADDVWILASPQASPGHGVLPVNAFVIGRDRPLLVDTGLPDERDGVLAALRSIVDPAELAGVFVTHEDPDHAGNLAPVLDLAPDARLVTGYVTLTKLLEGSEPVPLDRVQVVRHGDLVPGWGDRLQVLRPPLYDSPGALGLHDGATGTVLTVDAFGTYLPEAVDDLVAASDDDVRAGCIDFNQVNHPWAAMADQRRLDAAVDGILALRPRQALSSHGAVARSSSLAVLAEATRALPSLPLPVPPDHGEFESLRDQLG